MRKNPWFMKVLQRILYKLMEINVKLVKVQELSICHTLSVIANPYIFATQCSRP